MTPKASPKKSESFEKVISELEHRVEQLEREDLDLTKAIEIFKEAVVFAKQAQSKLDEAQKVVTTLVEDELREKKK
jgi:exodeoxyribonuclease VII small subunit